MTDEYIEEIAHPIFEKNNIPPHVLCALIFRMNNLVNLYEKTVAHKIGSAKIVNSYEELVQW